MIQWRPLTGLDQLNDLDQLSQNNPVVIFKHSTRCGVSATVLHRLESDWQWSDAQLPAYFLDLIQYREVSNEIEKKYRVWHESPQLIVLHKAAAVFDASHNNASAEALQEALEKVTV